MVSKFLAEELVRMGHEVEIVSTWFPGLPKDTREGNFRLRRLRALRGKLGQSNPIEMIAYVMVALPYLLFRRARRPDVIMSYHSIPSGLVGWPLSMLWRVPHIVQFHGGDVPGWLPGELSLYHKLTLWLNRLVVYQSAAAVGVSDGLRDLAQPSFPKKKIGVIQNGVNLERFAPPKEPREERTGTVRLMLAGRVTTQKGIDVLIRTLGQERFKALDWHLELAGEGPNLEEYKNLARTHGVADRITFHGWLDRPEVRKLYDRADVLVLPSRWEGMSIVILEALACGLPIIATRIAGTVQLVDEGVNGILSEPEDEGALGNALEKIISNRETRLRMGAESRRLAEEKWSWKAAAEQLVELTEECIARWK